MSDTEPSLPDGARVISWATRYAVSSVGVVYSRTSGRWRALKPAIEHGYPRVSITPDQGRPRQFYVHQLVTEAFIGERPEGQEVRHLDGNPSHNNIDNLAYGTHQENMRDMVRHGRQGAVIHRDRMARGDRHGSRTKPERVPRGERAGRAKLSDAQVIEARAARMRGERVTSIMTRLGISMRQTYNILHRRQWTHLGEDK